MKKIISVSMVILFLLSAFMFTVYGQDPVTLKLTSQQVYAGDEITLHLYVSGNSNISCAAIDINYDDKMLEFISAKEGAILDPKANISIRNQNKENSYVRFTYFSTSSSIVSEGILMSVTFKALDNVKGETELKISIPNPDDFISIDLERLPYNVVNSKIDIINDNIVESAEEEIETGTKENTTIVEEITLSETKDQGSDNSDVNVFLVSSLVAGIILIAIGIIVIKKKKS